jgi:small subunit ribosomal protein S20
MRRLLDQKDAEGAKKIVPVTFSLVDRAAKWGIIKKNTAARYKSRLTLRLRKVAETTK